MGLNQEYMINKILDIIILVSIGMFIGWLIWGR